MRRRAVLLGALLPLLLVTIAGAQSLTSIPTDPAGARGSATLCYNAVAVEWQPCSATNPLVTTPAGGGPSNVNVQQWGGTNTTLGQKAMGGSIPTVIASDQSAVPENVTQVGGAALTLGQKAMTGSLPVTMASDQSALLTTTTPGAETPQSGLMLTWFPATGVTGGGPMFVWTSDYSVLALNSAGGTATSYLSLDRGKTYSSSGMGTFSGASSDLTSIASNGKVVLVGYNTQAGVDTSYRVARTVNGGQTWTRVVLFDRGSAASAHPTCVVGLAGTTAIAFTDFPSGGNYAWRSTDSGATWATATLATLACNTPGTYNAIRLGASTWLAGGGNSGKPWRSTDDGQTWAAIGGLAGLAGAGKFVAVSTTSALYVSSAAADLYASTDSGGSWAVRFSFNSNPMTVIYSQGVLLVRLTSGAMMRSIDQGFSWSFVGNPSGSNCGLGGGYTPQMDANSFGEVAGAFIMSGSLCMSYAPTVLSGETILVGANGVKLAVDTAGNLTANQGAAAAIGAPWPVRLSDGSAAFGNGVNPLGATSTQGATLFNTSATGAANTAVVATVTGAVSTRTHLYGVTAFCSAGSASLIVADGVTTIWQTPAGAVGTGTFSSAWTVGLTATTAANIVVTLSTCGAGNTGTLSVQADRF